MKTILEYIISKSNKRYVIKATNDTINKIVKDELDKLGHDADLNHIDVREVTFMDSLFSCHTVDLGTKYRDLNPDISGWDVSKVRNMQSMFAICENFDCDISKWDVSNVIDMRFMFNSCKKFNQDLSHWDVKNVKYIECIFSGCPIKEEYKPKF